MTAHPWLRSVKSAARSIPAGRRARGRRVQPFALGAGLPRLEVLEDRTLLATALLPTATTQAATNFRSTGATLNGTVNPNSTSTDASFQYSTDPTLAPNVVRTLAGTPKVVGNFDATGSRAQFRGPSGVAVDDAGNVYVADEQNNTIRKITPARMVTTLAGSPRQMGSQDGTGNTARFFDPHGVAVDDAGNVYVADGIGNMIREITPAGVVTTLAGSPANPGIADGPRKVAQFLNPRGVAVDGAGNVYVADTGNSTIREITPAGMVTTLAGAPGQPGIADGTHSTARFNRPDGVAVDDAGNLYVADTGNSTIREITPAGMVTTLAGGRASPASPTAPTAPPGFSLRTGLRWTARATSTWGTRSTTRSARSRRPGWSPPWRAPGLGGIADGTGSAAQFFGPSGVAVDDAGNLYVADEANNTIRKLSPLTVPAQTGLTGTTDVPVNAPLTNLLPNTKYYFRAVAANSAGTATGQILNFTTTAQAATKPTATTQAATAVMGTTATLHGTVNPQGSASTAHFVYGTDATLTPGTTTTIPIPDLTIPAGTTDVPVPEPLTGLQPNTTYYYRVEATNTGGTTTGDILNFTTTAQTVTRPTITVGQATAVTSNGATVSAMVNPNGNATTVHFVYGTQPTLTTGITSTAERTVGSGTSPVPVTEQLTGLQPNTTYYFQAVATSNGITTPGPIQSFTTAAVTTTTGGLQVTNLQRFGFHAAEPVRADLQLGARPGPGTGCEQLSTGPDHQRPAREPDPAGLGGLQPGQQHRHSAPRQPGLPLRAIPAHGQRDGSVGPDQHVGPVPVGPGGRAPGDRLRADLRSGDPGRPECVGVEHEPGGAVADHEPLGALPGEAPRGVRCLEGPSPVGGRRGEIRCQFIILARKDELTLRQEARERRIAEA